jgi:hypothetical protein
MNDLISNEIVWLFGIVVDGFDECGYREISEIGCQNEFIKWFFKNWRLIVDID